MAYRAPKNKEIVCPECKTDFTEKRGLKKHIFRKHPQISKIEVKAILAPLKDRCPSCRKPIKSVSKHKKSCKKHQAALRRLALESRRTQSESAGADGDMADDEDEETRSSVAEDTEPIK